MNLTLERFCAAETAVFGRLLAPSFSCFTVERPWLDNRPFVSCIPEGLYPLRPRRYNRGGYETFEIADVPGRTHILIHRGNLPRHVQGCVAVGRALGCIGGEWAVTQSAAAFAAWWESVRLEMPREITVRWRLP